MKVYTRAFEVGHNSAHTRGFTWAASILPKSEPIHVECPEYGVVVDHPSGAFDVVVEGGSKYPDVLGCGAYPFLIVSDAVIRAWLGAEVSCFHTYPVGVAAVKAPRLRNVPPPQYHRVEIDGRCRIDLEASGLTVVRYDPKCHYLVTKPLVPAGFRMVPGSWDSCALFRDEELYPRVNFCTQLIIDIARQHQFTNFRFEPMEGPFNSFSKGIDYLKSVK